MPLGAILPLVSIRGKEFGDLDHLLGSDAFCGRRLQLREQLLESRNDTTSVRIAAIDDLIRLKRLSGRPQDLEDITQLELIKLERVKNKQTE